MDTMTKVNRKLRTLFDARVREQGLTLARARLLLLLAKEEATTQRDLAEQLEIEQPSLVALLDGLERQGLIERVPSPGDRRAKSVVLTEAARAETAAVTSYVDDLRDQLLTGIDVADLKVAQKVLTQVGRNIGALV
jgi:MarR family transcriptional regulator for hemolysin